MFFLKLCFLPMMVKVLSKTHRPFFCAFLYLLLIFSNGLMFDLALGGTWRYVGIECAKGFAMSALFFWALEEFDGTDAIYWSVLILGMLAMLMI